MPIPRTLRIFTGLLYALLAVCALFWAVLFAVDLVLDGVAMVPALRTELLVLFIVVAGGAIVGRCTIIVVEHLTTIDAHQADLDARLTVAEQRGEERYAAGYVDGLERRHVPPGAPDRHLSVVTPRP